jgi:hypothetical protein
LERKQEGMTLRGRTVSASHGGNGGGQKAKKGRKEKTGRDSAEGCGSDYETEKRQKMERKKNVKAELDSSNDSTSSRDKHRRQQLEDSSSGGDDDDDEEDSEGESGEDESSEHGSSDDEEDESDEDSDSDHADDEEDSEDESGSDQYNEENFLLECRTGRFSESTQSHITGRFETMKKWIEQDCEWNVSEAKAPFPEALCYKYLHFQMHRRTREGNIPGSGSLGGIIRMLKHEGFTKHGYHVPDGLLGFFRDAQNTLKRKIQQRIDDQKQHLPDSHAQNASWQSVEYCAQVLHDWKKDKNVRNRSIVGVINAECMILEDFRHS